MKKDIKVYKIAQTEIGPEIEVRLWLKENGCSDDYVADLFDDLDPLSKSDDNLLTGPEAVVALAGKRCYKSFEVGLNPNVTKIRRDWAEYLDNIIKSNHGSVFEHVSFTFAIENCTRVFTAEMNRHRVGTAISEQSLRYVRFSEDVPYWEPNSIKDVNNFDNHDNEDSCVEYEPEEFKLECKKAKTRHLFREAFQQAQKWMVQLETIWADELAEDSKFKAKKEITSMMRRLIPMGVSTGAIYTINMRQLRHIFQLRVTPHAEEEICYICGLMAQMMLREQPLLMQDLEVSPEGFVVVKGKG